MYNSYVSSVGMMEKTCPVCGKTFYVYDYSTYAYRIRKNKSAVPVCSWGCVRAYENKHHSTAADKKIKKIKMQLQGIREG